ADQRAEETDRTRTRDLERVGEIAWRVNHHCHVESFDSAQDRLCRDISGYCLSYRRDWIKNYRFLDFARDDRFMKISLGTDHVGFHYKEKVKELLTSLGQEVKDFGTYSEEPVDYPVFIRPAAEAVARGECDRGIVFGGSGNGEAMVANKVHGVRCALCWSEESARLSRQHNDANVLSIGERMISEELALNIV